MSEYLAPVKEMKFTLIDVVDIDDVTALEQYQDAIDDIVDAFLYEGARYASEVLSPTNSVGDKEGSIWSEQGVKTATGFKEAYASFVENGWNSICGKVGHYQVELKVGFRIEN
jgi:hypothetical protein